VGETIDVSEAQRVLEAAATKAASTEPVSALWEQRTRELANMRTNKVAIAALGAALLAKATNPNIDPLSLTERSGPHGYSARTIAQLLADQQRALKYVLGTQAPDPLAGSPWFGAERIDHITKWRASARSQADKLISWLSDLKPEDAAGALSAFLRVRMDVATQHRAQRHQPFAAATHVDLAELVRTLSPFVTQAPEEGRRGAAAAAAAFAAAGHRVEARVVNDPSQTDVDVLTPTGGLSIGIEVKQKPATAKDATDIAAGSAAIGASKAILCALDPQQRRLDDDGLRARADTEQGVALEIVYTVDELLRLALFSSHATRAEFLARFPAEMARMLTQLDASPDALMRWRAAAARWA
jgi:hypothetical protein